MNGLVQLGNAVWEEGSVRYSTRPPQQQPLALTRNGRQAGTSPGRHRPTPNRVKSARVFGKTRRQMQRAVAQPRCRQCTHHQPCPRTRTDDVSEWRCVNGCTADCSRLTVDSGYYAVIRIRRWGTFSSGWRGAGCKCSVARPWLSWSWLWLWLWSELVTDGRVGTWGGGGENGSVSRYVLGWVFGALVLVMVFVIFGGGIPNCKQIRITGSSHGQRFVSWLCCPFR